MSKTEYSKYMELTDSEKSFILIPSSLINQNKNDKVYLLLIYILFFVGVNNLLNINIAEVIHYYHYSDNEKIIKQFQEAFQILKQSKMISFNNNELENRRTKNFCIKLNKTKISSMIKSETEYYAILYYDEIKKIIELKKTNNRINISVVLLTLSYLKSVIPKRANKIPLSYESLTINEYKQALPEAFNCYIYDIANKINVSAYAVSNSIKVLKNLKIINYCIVQRWKNNDKWKRQHIIFALMYKRERGLLLANGLEYSNQELRNKYDLLIRKKIIKSIDSIKPKGSD